MNFTEEELKELYNTVKSKSELLRKLDIDYKHMNHSSIDKCILSYLSFMHLSQEEISGEFFKNRTKEREKKEYLEHPKYCLQCGNIIPFENKNNKCCSISCAASYGNAKKGKRSEETKRNISKGLKTSFIKKIENDSSYIKIEDNISKKLKSGYIKLYNIVCECCNKEFVSAYKTKYCSDECRSKCTSEKIKESIQRRIEEGVFSGWKSRNIISYAERFWIQVLNNNNIQYQKEFYLDKKYFLDFLIEKNNKKIDLEIDGKQHTYQERIEHDKERDEYVTNAGYIVYRIPWNSISSEKGSLEMKEKIDKFLEFYNSL